MEKSALFRFDNWISLFRQNEIRFGFFIFYMLLLIWPFFSRETWTIPEQYFYYFGVWLVLIIGLAIQGYLVIRKEIRVRRKSLKEKSTTPPQTSTELSADNISDEFPHA